MGEQMNRTEFSVSAVVLACVLGCVSAPPWTAILSATIVACSAALDAVASGQREPFLVPPRTIATVAIETGLLFAAYVLGVLATSSIRAPASL